MTRLCLHDDHPMKDRSGQSRTCRPEQKLAAGHASGDALAGGFGVIDTYVRLCVSYVQYVEAL
ncbi:hypothetical protein ACQEV9_46325 [Streptomyces chartreusis]|uniref:hypothetical protein n=1 Tax=Streptomyces chartreusis TaxID=1969 RepID=UPI003D92B044